MKKIIITGALGYLGMELCKIYSGESWKNKIIAIDSRFISERVSQLKIWGIQFLQGHILDNKFLEKNLKDVDVIYHLAGITDVAYVKTETNNELDQKIKSIGIEGTLNVLKNSSKNVRFIFPSTHVVFEGLKKIKKNISEDFPVKPILAYAKSKVQNEIDIRKFNKNFIILRLGSVYGYSLDNMRINIMPNLFSKLASQNSEIKLFGGGKQFKSLVGVIDVVRCMKFFEENKNYRNELYHLVNEQMNVKKVAEICKHFNPRLKISKTNDEVPNLGYTLSNKKLLKTGFKFLYNIKDSINEIIGKWKYVENKNDLEEKFLGQNEFIDKRGKISNYELSESINLIGYIESKSGTVRANHYHPIQEQKCLLVKGQFISIYKNLLEKNSPIITHVVNEGDLIVTKPNVAHSMVFTKNTIFLNLVKGERDHDNYGITHTIPCRLVDKKIKQSLISSYRFNCRCCGNKNLKRVVSLGMQPLANNLTKTKNEKVEFYPLEMNYCDICHNCQLSVSVKPEKMFNNYNYLSSTSKEFTKHFKKASLKYIKNFNLKKKSFIIDVGSNDGIGLKTFKELGFKNILGIEPAKNIAKIANKNGIKTINGYLNKKLIKKIKNKADIVLASNVFSHSDDLKNMAECMLRMLAKNGVLIIEVQYLLNTIKDLTFDNIYHEHYNYWSLTSLCYFFNKIGGKLFKAEKIKTHGGSIRTYISNNENINIDPSVFKLVNEEEKFGLKNYETHLEFGKRINLLREKVIKKIHKLKNKYSKIIGYGSPAKATTSLNFFGIDDKLIDFIVEDNKLKYNKFVPGVNIPIYPKSIIKDKNPLILVLAWNFFNEIKKNNKKLSKNFYNFKSLR